MSICKRISMRRCTGNSNVASKRKFSHHSVVPLLWLSSCTSTEQAVWFQRSSSNSKYFCAAFSRQLCHQLVLPVCLSCVCRQVSTFFLQLVITVALVCSESWEHNAPIASSTVQMKQHVAGRLLALVYVSLQSHMWEDFRVLCL